MAVSLCGNSVVEAGEQCDCGTSYTCAEHDKCCTPRPLNPLGSTENACQLKGACSPRVHRCCTSECKIAAAGTQCRQATDCTSASQCDGVSRSCPPPTHAANDKPCAGGRGKCKDGMCSVSACESAGLVKCLCRRPLNHACSLCCRCSSAPQDACVPAQWLGLASESLLAPNTTCIGGTCNGDSRCAPNLWLYTSP